MAPLPFIRFCGPQAGKHLTSSFSYAGARAKSPTRTRRDTAPSAGAPRAVGAERIHAPRPAPATVRAGIQRCASTPHGACSELRNAGRKTSMPPLPGPLSCTPSGGFISLLADAVSASARHDEPAARRQFMSRRGRRPPALSYGLCRERALARRAVPQLDRREMSQLLHGVEPCAPVLTYVPRCHLPSSFVQPCHFRRIGASQPHRSTAHPPRAERHHTELAGRRAHNAPVRTLPGFLSGDLAVGASASPSTVVIANDVPAASEKPQSSSP